MYLHKGEASVQSTLRATTISTITLAETRVIVSVCEILKASVRCEMGQETPCLYTVGRTWKQPTGFSVPTYTDVY